MREAVIDLGPQAHRLQQTLDLDLGLLMVGSLPVVEHGLGDGLADLQFRVQAGVGVLKDHLQLAAEFPLFGGGDVEIRDVLPPVGNMAGGHRGQGQDGAG